MCGGVSLSVNQKVALHDCCIPKRVRIGVYHLYVHSLHVTHASPWPLWRSVHIPFLPYSERDVAQFRFAKPYLAMCLNTCKLN